MTSLSLINFLKNEKFFDFSSDNDNNSWIDVFRDDIDHIINQCDPMRPNGAADGRKSSASCPAYLSEERRSIQISAFYPLKMIELYSKNF